MFKKRRRMRDNRDGTAFFVVRRAPRSIMRGQKIGSGEMLGRQNAIHRLQGKLTPAVKEIGEMRLAHAGLARQQGHAYRAPLYPAVQFQAELLVHLSEIHLRKIRHQQWGRRVPHFLWQTYQG